MFHVFTFTCSYICCFLDYYSIIKQLLADSQVKQCVLLQSTVVFASGNNDGQTRRSKGYKLQIFWLYQIAL